MLSFFANVYTTSNMLRISKWHTNLIISKYWIGLIISQMKKPLRISTIIIILIITALYILADQEYTEDEREWCKEHRPLLPIGICAKEFGY